MSEDGMKRRGFGPLQRRAYTAVMNAIKDGTLVRPKSCQECHNQARRGKDGRLLLQAHHHDYNFPLDVTWLCPICHRRKNRQQAVGVNNGSITQPHKVLKGVNHGRCKLSEQSVRSIRADYEGGRNWPYLADVYGVDRSTIRSICLRETWRSVQ